MTILNRVLIGIYSAFILYIALVLVIGDYGFNERRRLFKYREVLTENLKELESINQSLMEKDSMLRKEADTLRLYARNIDYYESNEGLILIDGIKRRTDPYSMGKMMSWKRTQQEKTPLFRILALSFGIIVFLLVTLFFPGEKNDFKL